METIQPLFYVQLRDDFDQLCALREKSPSFPGMNDPLLEARDHVSCGKVYPVIKVKGDFELLILDDRGYLYKTFHEFFKFSEPPLEFSRS